MGLVRIDPGGCQRICDLPDDLLLKILLLVPTKKALATAILSKRWRHVPRMLPQLIFKDDDQGSHSLALFIDEYLQLHRAPKLLSLGVELGHVDVDVRKWVEKAVNHGVRTLDFKLHGTSQPTTFPMSLYTCPSLVSLTLSDNILVDISFPASLPSLLYLELLSVLYKDDDSLARLLSSSPVLDILEVERYNAQDDNLTNFTVKVPTLTSLTYKASLWSKEEEEEEEEEDHNGSLVIDSPAVEELLLYDYREGYCSLIENMACLDEVSIRYVPNHDPKFLTCLSSTKRLWFSPSESMIACCNAIKFYRLIDLFFVPEDEVDWLDSLFFFLQNSPTLKTLTIDTEAVPPSSWSWNQTSTIPGCVSSHLELVRWKDYEGNKGEKKLMTYILANSKCLKTVEISLRATCNLEKCQKELKSMPRISTSSRLLYSTPQAVWNF